MLTGLDLLVVVVMVLAAVSLLGMLLMFLIKNRTVRRVFFYIVVGMGVYMGYVGARILWPTSALQAGLAIVLALTSIGALVMELTSKGNKKLFLTARILSAAALVIGMFNAFM